MPPVMLPDTLDVPVVTIPVGVTTKTLAVPETVTAMLLLAEAAIFVVPAVIGKLAGTPVN